MTAKELLLIVLSTAIWGPSLPTYKVLYQCDNCNVVAAINKGSARDVMSCTCLVAFGFSLPTTILIWYVNIYHGWLTLLQTTYQAIFTLNTGASLILTPLSAPLLEIISIPGPDWTSVNLSQLFISTINTI